MLLFCGCKAEQSEVSLADLQVRAESHLAAEIRQTCESA